LKKQFAYTVELKKSSGGRFEIYLDEKLIFSKAALSRFPSPGEIARYISDESE
jgi:selT/selW/selH-like putative selenoprotein